MHIFLDKIMSEPLDGVQETLVFAYALCNLPIGDLTKHTYYRNGMPLFPGESRRAANYKFQNHKDSASYQKQLEVGR